MNTENLYQGKTPAYFSNARRDWIDTLPTSESARLLEIGCGNGDTGNYALRERKCITATGIEISAAAAREANGKLTRVLVGDAEELEFPFDNGSFDILIMSEVLEHMVNPWQLLRKIKPFLSKGALVFSSSPNVAHYKVVLMLLRGDWRLCSEGVMDSTHLRWFTPRSYRELFETNGIEVDAIMPVTAFSARKKIFSWLTIGKFDHLLITQVNLRGHVPN